MGITDRAGAVRGALPLPERLLPGVAASGGIGANLASFLPRRRALHSSRLPWEGVMKSEKVALSPFLNELSD